LKVLVKERVGYAPGRLRCHWIVMAAARMVKPIPSSVVFDLNHRTFLIRADRAVGRKVIALHSHKLIHRLLRHQQAF
jgi:hypothetical protein